MKQNNKTMQKMIKFNVTTENVKEHNPNWPQILHHPHKILTIKGSGSGKNKIII